MQNGIILLAWIRTFLHPSGWPSRNARYSPWIANTTPRIGPDRKVASVIRTPIYWPRRFESCYCNRVVSPRDSRNWTCDGNNVNPSFRQTLLSGRELWYRRMLVRIRAFPGLRHLRRWTDRRTKERTLEECKRVDISVTRVRLVRKCSWRMFLPDMSFFSSARCKFKKRWFTK